MITQEDLDKLSEVARLHDEAFWHLHQFDGHAKSSDGSVNVEISLGNVWSRRDEPSKKPELRVWVYSYVVTSDTPLYPNFGDRHHEFESVDEALEVMRAWHEKAMAYQPTPEELDEADQLVADIWDAIKDKVTIIEVDQEKDN